MRAVADVAACAALAAVALCGCAGRIAIRSEPADAKVTLMAENLAPVDLGSTPIEKSSWELEDAAPSASSRDFFEFQVEKAGYVTERVFVPASRAGVSGTRVEVRLRVAGTPAKPHLTAQGARIGSAANEIVERLAAAERWIRDRRFDRAEAEAERALALEPGYPRALALRGHVAFAKRRWTEAKRWYEEALAADPRFTEIREFLALAGRAEKGIPLGEAARAPAAAAAPSQRLDSEPSEPQR